MVLNRLLTFTWIVTARLAPSRMSRLNDALATCPPGPMITLRGESPNCPSGGAANADVLKKSASDGSVIATGPATFARSDPLVPLATLLVAPTTRAVNGLPECAENVRFADHSPTIA